MPEAENTYSAPICAAVYPVGVDGGCRTPLGGGDRVAEIIRAEDGTWSEWKISG